ncbi:MAG: GTPase HflX [Alphaproteobacteria bacterium]
MTEPTTVSATGTPGRALIVHPETTRQGERGRSPQAGLDEAVGLAAAIDLDVALTRIVRVARINSATFLGQGVVEELKAAVEELEIGIAIVDTTLSPVQQRNLERAWNTKVIDRTGLILEIFGARARTAEGRLQVDLAALRYQRTRLVRSWTHLERQRGGAGFLGGPGESQIELDRRRIDDRIVRLERELEDVKRTRGLHRAARRRVPYPIIALVGYTNAGKSTLFNRLTAAHVVARDQLFATLDPTMRVVRLPSRRRVILSDTVGFISDLPTQLVAAFRATLEEVLEADVILHVRDIADAETEIQNADVAKVLAELGIASDDARIVEVLNKIDLLDAAERDRVAQQSVRGDAAVTVSALTGEGEGDLLAAIDRRIARSEEVVRFAVDAANGAAIAWLYENGNVLDRQDDGSVARIAVGLDPADRARFERRFAAALL